MNAYTPVSLPNGWNFIRSEKSETLPGEAVEEAIVTIGRWVRAWKELFPQERTLARALFGIPSLFIRLEGTWKRGEGWRLNEIEERPCGLGATGIVNTEFQLAFARLISEFPRDFVSLRSVSCPERITDDSLWTVEVPLGDALGSEGPLLVRSRPEQTSYHALTSRAISTVENEGHKGYGCKLGLWSILNSPEDLPTFPCVIKPLQGTRCRGVLAHFPEGSLTFQKGNGERRPFLEGSSVPLVKQDGDTVGREGLLRRLAGQEGKMVCQPFILPMRFEHEPDKNGIYRFYFGYSPQRGRYVPLGGVWTASRSLRVHGHEGVVFGPLHFRL